MMVTELPNRSVRSEAGRGDGSGQVLQAVMAASARSISTVGLGLSSAFGNLTTMSGRITALSGAADWTTLGTAAVHDWISR